MRFLGIMANARNKIIIRWISKERTREFFHLVKYAGFLPRLFPFPQTNTGNLKGKNSETHYIKPTITDSFLNYQESEIGNQIFVQAV